MKLLSRKSSVLLLLEGSLLMLLVVDNSTFGLPRQRLLVSVRKFLSLVFTCAPLFGRFVLTESSSDSLLQTLLVKARIILLNFLRMEDFRAIITAACGEYNVGSSSRWKLIMSR